MPSLGARSSRARPADHNPHAVAHAHTGETNAARPRIVPAGRLNRRRTNTMLPAQPTDQETTPAHRLHGVQKRTQMGPDGSA